ncbi:MAG: DUF805 domain-containing protein [Oxalobacteraceae bacterium]|nr:MAG: DUF805 domain-containing protein [Oxalobacteraceae bacterium]
MPVRRQGCCRCGAERSALVTRFLTPLRLYAHFEGRASRVQFWPFSLVAWTVEAVAVMIAPPLGGLVILALMLPLLSVLVRRLHDTDRTAWWLLPPPLLMPPLLFLFACTQFTLGDEAGRKIFTGIGVILAVMLVYAISLVVVLAQRGTAGPNRFGPDPLADGASIKRRINS